jgi:hypothetical protein
MTQRDRRYSAPRLRWCRFPAETTFLLNHRLQQRRDALFAEENSVWIALYRIQRRDGFMQMNILTANDMNTVETLLISMA